MFIGEDILLILFQNYSNYGGCSERYSQWVRIKTQRLIKYSTKFHGT